MNGDLVGRIVKARKVGVPLLAVGTPDQPALEGSVMRVFPQDDEAPVGVIAWDCARGLRGLNPAGKASLGEIPADELMASKFAPVAMGNLVPRIASEASQGRLVVFAHNLQRQFGDPEVVQAVANLRDAFKRNGRMLIIAGPEVNLPAELRGDVVSMEDPLPDDAGYTEVATRVHKAIKAKCTTDQAASYVPAVRGLSGFVAEQVLAMSIDLTKGTLVQRDAWRLKQEAIAQVRGLTMTLDGPRLQDLKGLDALVEAYTQLFAGPRRPECVVLLDEIEKMMAGLGTAGGPGDNTGVTQDALMNILTSMEGYGWTGSILVGIPGGGKTMFAEAIGAAHGVPLVKMDIGAMKQKHVGESEAAFRDAMRAIRNVGRDRVAILATCNQISAMPPELQSRFRLGTWYIDLPGQEEREAMAKVYRAKYGLPADAQMPDTTNWTGREVRNACEIADSFGITPAAAARYIVPVSKADPGSIDRLRSLASGHFLSATHGGVYDRDRRTEQAEGRQIEL